MEKNKQLRIFAEQIRVETLRSFDHLNFGHVGGAMSIIETLAVLYGGEMKIDPKNPKWEDRDKLVMSKGHAGPALYATLALKGYFPLDVLMTLNQGGTSLPSHCDRQKTIGVDMTTGSLGQGISTACGLALANKINHKDSYTYLIMGDGECDEGEVWEGAMFAPQFKLKNLVAFVDLNKQQLDGYCDDIMFLGDMVDKFRAFGWYTQKINGHDIDEIQKAIANAKAQSLPSMIVLDTVKGNGCDLALNTFPCHHLKFKAGDMTPSLKAAEDNLSRLLNE